MTLEEKIQRGRAAEELLGSGMFMSVFGELKEEYAGEWIDSSFNQKDDREAAYFRTRALVDIRRAIDRIITEGKFASERLRKQQ